MKKTARFLDSELGIVCYVRQKLGESRLWFFGVSDCGFWTKIYAVCLHYSLWKQTLEIPTQHKQFTSSVLQFKKDEYINQL
jgi:hypothetical protein